MKIPYVFKVCTKCGEPKVANTEYFYKRSECRYGLMAQCKECKKKRDREYRQTDKFKEYQKEYQKEYRQTDKRKEYEKKYYESDKGKEVQKRYRKSDKGKEVQKRYQQTDKYKAYRQSDKRKEYQKKYDKERRQTDKYKAYRKSDKYKEAQKRYQQTDKYKVAAFNNRQRRRIKEQNQGSGITSEQWKECMDFFGWKCAYSGKSVDEQKNRSLDHVVPLNKGGANEIWNVVPMVRNYNSSKKDKPMEEWYEEQEYYSEERLQKIYEWLEYAYKK